MIHACGDGVVCDGGGDGSTVSLLRLKRSSDLNLLGASCCCVPSFFGAFFVSATGRSPWGGVRCSGGGGGIHSFPQASQLEGPRTYLKLALFCEACFLG